MIYITAFLSSILDFITSVIGQIVLWGMATFSTFIYTLISWLNSDSENFDKEVRCATAVLVSLFWTFNIILWFSGGIKFMLFTDGFFTVVSAIVFHRTKIRWSLHLAKLYGLAFIFDLLLWNNLGQSYYAVISNIVFAFQLLTIVGAVDWDKFNFWLSRKLHVGNHKMLSIF